MKKKKSWKISTTRNSNNTYNTAAHYWPFIDGLKSEREGFIVAMEDQNLRTGNSVKEVRSLCRICGLHPETIGHLMSSLSYRDKICHYI